MLALAGCQTGPSASDGRGEGSFYTYLDADGRLITLERPRAAGAGDDVPRAASAERDGGDGADDGARAPAIADGGRPPSASAGDSAEEDRAEAPLLPLASTPDELWRMDDAYYVPDADIESRLAARDRERFVTVHDESGRLVARRVDMLEAREAARARSEAKDYSEIDPAPRLETGEAMVPADCCLDGLADAPVLKPGNERALKFAPHAHLVRLAAAHPATTVRLAPDVTRIRVRSWLVNGGYVHPQLMLVDATGTPLELVESPFGRRYPETWRSHAFLEGELPVPPEAYAVVFFLRYAQVEGRDVTLEQGMRWQEPDHVLRREGDVTVTAFRD